MIGNIFSRDQVADGPDMLLCSFQQGRGCWGVGKAGFWLACYLSAARWTGGLSS